MNVVLLGTLLSFGIGAGVILFTILNYDKLARFLPVARLSVIEKDLVNLRTVIVVADRVERPTGALEDAVEDNFGENVKYLFLVSKKRAENELSGYFLIFEALAKKAIAKMDEPVHISDLVEIRNLTYDWPDVPYIFYQHESTDGELLTAAFRGNQKGEGIADAYEQLTDSHSLAIASALLAEAPEIIRGNLKVVPFDKKLDLHEVKKA